jgi:ADP-heptose:LPS heptosyltransferase
MIRDIAPRRRVAAAVVSLGLAVGAAPLLALNTLRRRRHRPVSRVLVIEPWGIGDLVLATGALRSCRAAYPDAHITVLAKGYAESIVVAPEMANDVVTYDLPWTAFTEKYRLSRYRFSEIARLIWRLRRARYDLVLNARADVRNNLLGALIGGTRFVSAKCGLGDFLASDVVALEGDAHRVEDWATVVARATANAPSGALPRLTVSERARAQLRSELGLTATNGPIVGIHPGARIAVRRWELSRFASVADALANEFGATVLVFAEPDGYGADLPARTPFVVVRRGLSEMVAALSLCNVFVCNDSGPMHLASAVGVPVAAIFGPTNKQWFGPRGARAEVVQISDVPCRPCFDVCRFPVPFCMTEVNEAAVITAAATLLRDGSGLTAPLAIRHRQAARA